MVWRILPDVSAIYSPGVRADGEWSSRRAEHGGPDFYAGVVRPLIQGKPLEHPERMPAIGYIPKARKRFYGVMSMLGQFGVTEEVKDFIETWEPGVHEFYPITLVAEDTGETMPVTYYVLNICNLLDSVVLDHPGVIVNRHGEGENERVFWKRAGGPLVFHRDVVRGKHLWRDGGAKTSIFASDAFVEAFEARKVKGWRKDEHFDEV